MDTAWFTLLSPDFDFEADAADPFAATPLRRQPDGSFAATVKLDPVLDGDYLAIVYGLSGGQELMPAAKRQQRSRASPVSREYRCSSAWARTSPTRPRTGRGCRSR